VVEVNRSHLKNAHASRERAKHGNRYKFLVTLQFRSLNPAYERNPEEGHKSLILTINNESYI
jgi:hypothetical protein